MIAWEMALILVFSLDNTFRGGRGGIGEFSFFLVCLSYPYSVFIPASIACLQPFTVHILPVDAWRKIGDMDGICLIVSRMSQG
ncbi:hypothetical protein B0T24DRAFT_627901 [Lasiosphaeria ovina]|uniref:Uncharacterized protein n=1 Tax=Lasiosphaeria ovina TaxID=92902 RepID=A0AAE0K7V0_9PEZI|nr:hypothetical protein B0T24DRAFT_627901 [Lasiosphaeria ovina]